jgi:tight adherence protein B
MIFLILFFFLITMILLFLSLFQSVFIREKKLEKRLQRYLSVTNEKASRDSVSLLKKYQQAKKKIGKKMASNEKNTKLAVKLARSGLPYRAEEFLLFQWILTVITGGILYLLTGLWYFFIIGAVPGYLFPKWYLRKKERERIEKFNEGLTDMVTTIIGSLRAGFSFPQALKTVVEEAGPPIKDEMESVLKEMQYGSSIEDSLNNLKERMPSDDLDLMIQAIVIQRQVGGNLATVLEKIVETIRDRTKIQRQIRTLTAQGRLSGIVVGLLPVILGLLIYFIQPDYIATLFHHPIGIILIAAGVVSGTIGFLLIKKITTIEV